MTAFNNLVDAVRDQMGKLRIQVQVTIDFDPNADYPKLTFANPEALPDEIVGLVFTLHKANQSALDKEPGT